MITQAKRDYGNGKVAITLTLSPEALAGILELAKKEYQSKSHVANMLILSALKN